MIASVLSLNRSDIKRLKITDTYSLHRVVYSLYEDIRSDSAKLSGVSSGILYADKGGDWNSRQILMLSTREPITPIHGEVRSKPLPSSFLEHDKYAFEVIINPTKREKCSGKIVALRSQDEIAFWFMNKSAQSWGFYVVPSKLQIQNIGVKEFDKKGQSVTLGSATVIGQLVVADRSRFIESFEQGIGRARAFGFGLLQIKPLLTHITNQGEELK